MSQDEPQKPEEFELQSKLKELAIIEAELTERELELATVQASLHTFEQRSKAELDPRYEELANLQQRIADLSQRLKPAGENTPEKAAAAPAPARTPKMPRNRKPRPASPAQSPAPKQAPAASKDPAPNPENLKRLYRDVAKAIHPDLADDDIERQHRHALMVKANEAYDAGDELKLSLILQEWESSPEAIRGAGSIPDLIRAIRRIHRGKLRLATISRELTRITGTSLYNLKTMSDEATQFERDLLKEMTDRIDSQIADAKAEVARLEALVPPEPEATAEGAGEASYEPMYVQTLEPDPPAPQTS